MDEKNFGCITIKLNNGFVSWLNHTGSIFSHFLNFTIHLNYTVHFLDKIYNYEAVKFWEKMVRKGKQEKLETKFPLTNWFSSVDVNDKARSLIAAEDLVSSYKGKALVIICDSNSGRKHQKCSLVDLRNETPIYLC